MQPLAGTKRAASKPIFNPRQTQQKVFQATKKVNTLLPPQLRGRANEPTQDDFARAPNFAFAFPPVTPSANALDPNVLKIAVAPDATNALRLDVLHSFGSAPPIEAERIVILPLRSFVAAPEVERDARSPLARAHAPYVICLLYTSDAADE